MSADEKKSKQSILIKAIIILLVIHLFLTLSRCTTTKEEYVNKEVPINEPETIEESFENCTEKEFDWDYKWEGWYPGEGQIITQRFRLYNYDIKRGVFKVDFAFFDDSEYPYENYEGKRYDSIKSQLPWNSASMWVNNVTQSLGPYQKILLTPSVEKKDPAKVYWAIADVTVPTYEKCTTEYYYTKRNKTIMVNKSFKRNVTTTKSLWQLLVNSIM